MVSGGWSGRPPVKGRGGWGRDLLLGLLKSPFTRTPLTRTPFNGFRTTVMQLTIAPSQCYSTLLRGLRDCEMFLTVRLFRYLYV